MSKIFILASCGIILALIVAAASQSKVNQSQELFDYKFHKCSNAVDEPQCVYKPKKESILEAEKFLRGVKYKARIAYA